jgi:hypothetical protein
MSFPSSLVQAALKSAVVAILMSCSERTAESHAVPSPEQSSPETALVTFEVLEISPFPDPATSEYPDCLRTARLRWVGSDGPSGGEAQIVMGALPAFVNRTLAPGGRLEAGNRFQGLATAIEETDGPFRRMQMADSIEDFLLDLYIIENVTRHDHGPWRASSGVQTPDRPSGRGGQFDLAGLGAHPCRGFGGM